VLAGQPLGQGAQPVTAAGRDGQIPAVGGRPAGERLSDSGGRSGRALLRPHLYQAYLDAERRRHPLPELTARHWQLLDLLAAGHTNTQIARRLGLSEGTVRTHLENIYRRPQVSSRTAAVTRAFQDRGVSARHAPAASEVNDLPGFTINARSFRPARGRRSAGRHEAKSGSSWCRP
jgi:DNA-binding CsgD family transcriptional regulator